MTLEQAAERALVGALLLDPSHVEGICEWLLADDLMGTGEVQAYEAITRLHAGRVPVTPQAVHAAILAVVPRGTQVADGPFLVTVMQETPSAERAAIYGRMVLELAIRRRVIDDATRLRQHAEAARTTNDLHAVFVHVDAVQRDVEGLHDRVSRAAGGTSAAPMMLSDLGHLRRPCRDDERAVERCAIRSLIEQPDCIEHVSRWLRSDDFSDLECATLFAELGALRAASNPIDRVTVAWRAAKVGIAGSVCDALAGGRPHEESMHAVDASRRVLEQSVRAAVMATSDELTVVAADPSVNPTNVAYSRLVDLRPQQHRLVRARVAAAGT